MNKINNGLKLANILAILINIIVIFSALISARNPDLTAPIHPGVRLIVLICIVVMIGVVLIPARDSNTLILDLFVIFFDLIVGIWWVFDHDLITSTVFLVVSTFLSIIVLLVWTPPLKGNANEN